MLPMLSRSHKLSGSAAVLFFLWLVCSPVQAALNIEIFGGGANQIPVAIVPFAEEERLGAQSLTPVISADLRRAGLFKLIDAGGLTTSAPL